ncbi:unnamed protein product, partial [Adineta steineri]
DLVQFRTIVNETSIVNTNSSQSFKFPIDDDTEIDGCEQDLTTDVLPKHEQQQQQLPRLIPFVYDVNTHQSLLCVLTHIQLLWELILLNEPIAILGSFPTECSQTIQALGKLFL